MKTPESGAGPAHVQARHTALPSHLQEDYMSLSFNKQHFGLILPLLIVLALAVLAGCGSSSTAASSEPTATVAPANSPTVVATDTPGSTGSTDNQVKVSNFQFSPATLTVKAGTTVSFKGVSGSHTVTSDADSPMAFDQSISSGDTVTITFAKAGTYKYHCSIHASMHGVIVVTA
jgi:plastocyanin